MPWRAADGSVGGIVLFAEDITQRASRRKSGCAWRPACSPARAKALRSPIRGHDSGSQRCIHADHRLQAREKSLGQNPRLLQSGLQSKEFYERDVGLALGETGHWSGEIWNRSKGGEIYPEMLTSTQSATQRRADAICGAVHRHHGNQEAGAAAQHVAHYDALTGLPNRALFADRLRQAMAQALRNKRMLAAVAYFDLDGFKAINDSYGHAIGDALLTAMAFRMKRA